MTPGQVNAKQLSEIIITKKQKQYDKTS